MSVAESIHVLDQPKEAKASNPTVMLDWLEQMFRWGLQAREPYERKALKAFLFWAGDQWASVEQDLIQRHNRRVTRPPFCESARVIDNQIPIYIRQVISMCSDAMSDYEAVPATSDLMDREAAALATRLLKMRERVDREDVLREEELLWLFGAGEVLRRTYYDPYFMTPDGMEGDLRSEVISLFRYVTCPSSAGTWPPRWLIEFDSRHVDWVQERYGHKPEPENVADQMRSLDALAMNVMMDKQQAREEDKSSVIVKRLYAAPSTKYPEGRVFVWVKDKLLKEHAFQVPGTFPFSKAVWYPIPGRLYGMSYLEPLLSDQRSLNILLSQVQEAKNRQLRGDVAVQGAGEFTQEIVDSTTGQKLIRIPQDAIKFEFMDYDLNTRLAEQDYTRLKSNLHDKAGLAEPTLGQVTNRKTTATELQLLRESGFQSIAYHIRNFDRHQTAIGSAKILLAAKYFTGARVIQDVGDSAITEIEYFFGAELRNTRDVMAITTPKMTPAIKRQATMQAAEAGWLTSWRDAQGVPDPILQLDARTKLRELGLYEYEDRLSQRFGSYDDLADQVAEITKIGHEFWIARAKMAMQLELQQGEMALAQAQGMVPPMAPQPMAPEAETGATVTPDGGYMPPADGTTPTDDVLV